MTAATGITPISSTRASSVRMPLQFVVGFFFAFRICTIYIAFQSNPSLGGVFILAVNACLLMASMFCTIGDGQFSYRLILRSRTLRWLGAYVLVMGASVFWSAADSPLIAAGYWSGMAMEVATVLLLARGRDIPQQVDAMFKGFVVGASLVAAIAWLSPTLPDMRIGHEEFLVANIVGLYSALGFFLAQHLTFRNPAWKWCCLGLGMALLRTLSKTTIIAFLIAESLYLLTEKQISRSTKIKIGTTAVVIVAAFSGLIANYLGAYSAEQNGPESLTGRTLIWATALYMGLEQPWFGHGLYSFRTLMPAFGAFQPWHAHNELLQQFFEVGLIGVALIVALYLSLLRAARSSPARPYARLSLVLVIFSMIHGLADTSNIGPSLPAWMFAALGVALVQSATQESLA